MDSKTSMSPLRARVVEITEEYWDGRETLTERVQRAVEIQLGRHPYIDRGSFAVHKVPSRVASQAGQSSSFPAMWAPRP